MIYLSSLASTLPHLDLLRLFERVLNLLKRDQVLDQQRVQELAAGIAREPVGQERGQPVLTVGVKGNPYNPIRL